MKSLPVRMLFVILMVFYYNSAQGAIVTTVRNSLIRVSTGIRSDVVVTGGFQTANVKAHDEVDSKPEDENQPGWLRRQLLRFGEMTGVVGNKLGGFTGRVAATLDKLCEVIKTVIPVIAAVCHVGQFEFCGSINEAPQELADALSSTNLDIPD